jgi:hypothetical protein
LSGFYGRQGQPPSKKKKTLRYLVLLLHTAGPHSTSVKPNATLRSRITLVRTSNLVSNPPSFTSRSANRKAVSANWCCRPVYAGGGGGGCSAGGCVKSVSVTSNRAIETYRRWWSLARRRRWRATCTVVHRRHAGRRRWHTHTRWRSRSPHRRGRRWITRVCAIPVARLPPRWRRLLPRSGTGRPVATCLGPISIVSAMALCSPGCRRLAIIITARVARALLPGSHIASRRTTLPWFHIRVVVTFAGSSFDATGHIAVLARRAARQFLHELLDIVSV